MEVVRPAQDGVAHAVGCALSVYYHSLGMTVLDTNSVAITSGETRLSNASQYRRLSTVEMLEYLEHRVHLTRELLDRLDLRTRRTIVGAVEIIVDTLTAGGKLLIAGNGGSAAEAQHMAAELVGRFTRERLAVPAIALTTDTSILTAVANDYDYSQVFARQIRALGKPGDTLVVISTSGRSPNVVRAVEAARQTGIRSIALLGQAESTLEQQVDAAICLPASDSPSAQEGHLVVIHILCGLVESSLGDGVYDMPARAAGEAT